MKHSANIEPVVSRSFDLPLETLRKDIEGFDETRDCELVAYSLPTSDGEWHPLPEKFLDGIDFASRLTGSEVVVADGKAYASDNLIAVEYDIGDACPFKLTLRAEDVRAVKAFGTSPSHAFWSGGYLEPQQFMWSNGGRLQIPDRTLGKDIATRVRALLDGFGWNDLHEVDAAWRAQIAGHFAFKTVRNEEGLLRIRPGRIAGGVFDNRPDTELIIETFTDREVQFTKAIFFRVLKVATSIKFVYDGDRTWMLFRGENVRGVAASRYWVAS